MARRSPRADTPPTWPLIPGTVLQKAAREKLTKQALRGWGLAFPRQVLPEAEQCSFQCPHMTSVHTGSRPRARGTWSRFLPISCGIK